MTAPAARPTGLRAGFRPRSPWLACAVLAAVLALVVAGLTAPHRPAPKTLAAGANDASLYARVVERVRGGESYYAATIDEQRRGDYPVRPFVAVRPPTLAYALAALPGEAARRGALIALAFGVIAAWAWRLARMRVQPIAFAALLLAVGSGAGLVFSAQAYLFHETWAGLLIALSLALRRPGAWRASLILALLAAATRELAGAYLLAMAALAWRDGQRREAVAWSVGLALFAAALLGHAALVDAQLRPGDPASQGWVRIGGWPFVLKTLHWNLLLIGLPAWASAILAPIALAGLLGWRDGLGERVALTVLGYVAAFAVVGRPENNYWGVLIAPIWPLGLALAPAVFRELLAMLRLTPRRA